MKCDGPCSDTCIDKFLNVNWVESCNDSCVDGMTACEVGWAIQ